MEAKPYSFSSACKEEAGALPRGKEASLSLLSSYFRLRGAKEGTTLVFPTEQAKIATALYSRVREAFSTRARFAYRKGEGYLSRTLYKVLLDDPDGEREAALGIAGKEPSSDLVEGEERGAAYAAGAFLAHGSVSAPSSSNYHLEIVSPSEEAPFLLRFLQKTGPRFPFQTAKRGKKILLYLKRSSSISDFLIYIGATENCLRFENARVDRDFALVSNRFSNLDGANYRRTAKAGEEQLAAIARASKNPNYLAANPKLAALVSLRLSHPDSSMSELASLMGEMLGCTVSKSNVNHLFRKIISDYGDRK